MEGVKKKCYPKMIQKKGEDGSVETTVVKDAYEHASKVKEGWSGPPEWESALPDLVRDIEETEVRFKAMKERRVFMESFEEERANPGAAAARKAEAEKQEAAAAAAAKQQATTAKWAEKGKTK